MQRLRGPVTTMTGPRPEPRSNVNPALTRKRRRRVVENYDYVAFLRRAIRALGRRIAAGDIDSLADAAYLSAQLDATIKDAITALRQRGYSWADVGLQFGVTRQAAQQRWGGDSE
jgi:hypothetical protein